MEGKFTQIRMFPLPLTLMAGFLFAQEKQESDSISFADSLSATHTVHYLTRGDLQHSPIRDLPGLLALQNGIILQDGLLHARGGRAGQIAYFVDGANATNAFFNSANFTFIPEAVQEIQIHTGAYSAEHGGANSALVQTVLRTGGEKLAATIDYRTDDFAKPGEQFFGTSSFGLRNAVMTLGGPMPLIPKLRFFLAGQYNYFRNRDIIFLEPFRFDNLITDQYDFRPDRPLPGPVVFERNNLPGNWSRHNSVQGTLVYETKPLALRFTGLYTDAQNPLDTNWPNALENFFRRRRGREQDRTALASLKATHRLCSSISYELGVSYAGHSNRKFDPNFGDNWMLYTDSLVNSQLDYTGFLRRYRGALPYSTIVGFKFLNEDFPLTTYARNEQSRLGASFDFTAQIAKSWELKAGGRFDKWTMRLYSVGNSPLALETIYGAHGHTFVSFPNQLIRRVTFLRQGQIDNYGHDVKGERVDAGIEHPHRPSFRSFYLQNKFVFHRLIANLGLRYERFDLQVPRPANLLKPIDLLLDWVEESKLVKTKPNDEVLPRLSFSFSPLQQTELFAAYGKYAQTPPLQEIYLSPRRLSLPLSPITGGLGYYVRFTAKPEHATLYEFGLRQTWAKNFILSATCFFKDFPNLLRPASVFAGGTPTNPQEPFRFFGWLNYDNTQVKGLELSIALHRIKRLSAKVNYTYSKIMGTEADLQSLLNWFPIPYTLKAYPLDYDHKHRGVLILDYRFDIKERSRIFSGLGLNVILNYGSGSPFTPVVAPQSLGTSNPWNVGVMALANSQNFFPVSEPNAFNIPSSTNVDLSVSKLFELKSWTAEFYFETLNVFNNKATINVYPQTGNTYDGWLTTPLANYFLAIPNYESFYKAINDNNHWAYSQATGNDLFSAPRQMRLGLRLGL